MIEENIKVSGQLHIVLRDANGNIKDERHLKNLVVTTGKNAIAARLQGTSVDAMTHISLGTNTTSPVVGNTALGAEIVGSRVAMTVSGGTVVDATVTYSATFGAGIGTGAVTEAGIFNASSAGTMLCRTTFSPVGKDAADTLSISWSVTIA